MKMDDSKDFPWNEEKSSHKIELEWIKNMIKSIEITPIGWYKFFNRFGSIDIMSPSSLDGWSLIFIADDVFSKYYMKIWSNSIYYYRLKHNWLFFQNSTKVKNWHFKVERK